MSGPLPPGITIQDTPEKVLLHLVQRGMVAEAYALGRLLERLFGDVGLYELSHEMGVSAGLYRHGGFLSHRAGVFAVNADGDCECFATEMS